MLQSKSVEFPDKRFGAFVKLEGRKERKRNGGEKVREETGVNFVCTDVVLCREGKVPRHIYGGAHIPLLFLPFLSPSSLRTSPVSACLRPAPAPKGGTMLPSISLPDRARRSRWRRRRTTTTTRRTTTRRRYCRYDRYTFCFFFLSMSSPLPLFSFPPSSLPSPSTQAVQHSPLLSLALFFLLSPPCPPSPVPPPLLPFLRASPF